MRRRKIIQKPSVDMAIYLRIARDPKGYLTIVRRRTNACNNSVITFCLN